MASPALAAKGAPGGGGKGGGGTTGGGGGTITGPVLVNSSDGIVNYDDVVRFNVSTTATSQPWVNLQCFQNRTLVAQGWEGYFPGSLDDGNFTLASPKWTGGAADCTAYLTTPDHTVLASTSFHVYA